MFLPLLCLVLAAPAATSAAELQRRSYPLDAVLPVAAERAITLQLLPLAPSPDGNESIGGATEPAGTVAPAELADLVAQAVAPEEWEYEGRSIELVGERLVVVAPPQVQDDVRRFLQHVRSLTRPQIRVRVDLYEVPAGTTDVVLGHLESVQGLAGLTLRQSVSLDLLPSRPAERVAGTQVAYLRDVDVEIAQAATTHQPIPDTYELGTRVMLRADPGPDGRLLVTYGVRTSWETHPPELVEVRAFSRIATERGVETLNDGAQIQSPEVSFATLAGTVRLRRGETATALATVPGDADAPGVLLAVTAEEAPPVPEPFRSGDRVTLLRNVAGALGLGWSIPPIQVERFRALGDEELRYPDVLELGPPEQPADLEYAIYALLDAAIEAEQQLGQFGTFAYAIGPAASAQSWMDELVASLAREEQPALAVVAAPAPGRSSAVPVLGLLASSGDALAFVGRQRSYVLDYDVDVANNAATFNPKVHVPLDGVAAVCSSTPAPDGTAARDLTLLCQLHVPGSGAGYEPRGGLFGILHQPTFLTSYVTAALALPAGGATSLGEVHGRTGAVELSVTTP